MKLKDLKNYINKLDPKYLDAVVVVDTDAATYTDYLVDVQGYELVRTEDSGFPNVFYFSLVDRLTPLKKNFKPKAPVKSKTKPKNVNTKKGDTNA